MVEQLKKSNAQLEYFSYHMKRCKKDSDKVRLMMLITATVVYMKCIIEKNAELSNI